MNDDSADNPVNAAIERVLSHPAFSQYNRDDLGSCDRFCQMLRDTRHEDILELRRELEDIAYETDDHNEASGFLMTLINLGGGFNSPPLYDFDDDEDNNIDMDMCRALYADIPMTDTEQFFDWAISVPVNEREPAYVAAMDALLKRVVRIRDDDYQAKLVHHQINIVLHYVLRGMPELLAFGNAAFDNLDSAFNIPEQIPQRLWQGFLSRSEDDVNRLIDKWWGPGSTVPQDFFLALEWQRAGYIHIHKGKYYYQTVAEYLLYYCEPDEDDRAGYVRSNHGIDAIRLDPFLEAELYEAIAGAKAYRWLISENIPHRAEYLNSLFAAGVLKRERILSALHHGISRKWDKQLIDRYQELLERLSA